MAEKSAIEWTDSTFNPWSGCTKISPACDHCYAAALSHRLGSLGEWGAGAPRKRTGAGNWAQPVRWNARSDRLRQCLGCGWRGEVYPGDVHCTLHDCGGALTPARRRVFCASLADWLDNEVPIEWLADLLDLVRRTPNLDWLLLTKRVGNFRGRMNAAVQFLYENRSAEDAYDLIEWIVHWCAGYPPANVWLGATICNREEMLRDAPKLKRIPAVVHFWSNEPLLGDLGEIPRELMPSQIIAGGESGPHARPTSIDWARGLRDQCQSAGVPFLWKQWGEWLPMLGQVEGVPVGRKTTTPDGWVMGWAGKKAAGRLLDGVEHNGFPVQSVGSA